MPAGYYASSRGCLLLKAYGRLRCSLKEYLTIGLTASVSVPRNVCSISETWRSSQVFIIERQQIDRVLDCNCAELLKLAPAGERADSLVSAATGESAESNLVLKLTEA